MVIMVTSFLLPSARMRQRVTVLGLSVCLSVCLCVCLSVCYHYFSETVSLDVVLKVPNGSGRHSAEFYKNRFLYKRFVL